MNPVAADIAKTEVRPPAAQARRRSSAPKSGRSSRGFILGTAALLIFASAWALLFKAIAAGRHASPADVSEASRRNAGTIMLAPEGEFCRQLGLDNRSGRTVEMGRIKCTGTGAAAPTEGMRERYSGGRLESIRRSFSDR